MSDHRRRGVGGYGGWGTDDDQARPQSEREGPSIFPLAYRNDRMSWSRTLGCLWVPAIAVVLTIEIWLNVPQEAVWLSLLGLFPAFLLASRWIDRKIS